MDLCKNADFFVVIHYALSVYSVKFAPGILLMVFLDSELQKASPTEIRKLITSEN